jgi:hypothetical protein
MYRALFFIIALFYALSFSQHSSKDTASATKIPLPPIVDGGLTSLWYNDHKHILDEYGDFELLNYKNAGFKLSSDSLNAYAWRLFVMGDYVEKELSYATVARLKNSDKGVLLVFFRWFDPTDTTKKHGVFYTTFLAKDKCLLRTKQSLGEGFDTLEISCGDLNRRCGMCYYDMTKKQMVFIYRCALFNADADKNKPHRLFRGAAVWACDAGHGNRAVGMQDARRALRHRSNGLLADCAESFERFVRDA